MESSSGRRRESLLQGGLLRCEGTSRGARWLEGLKRRLMWWDKAGRSKLISKHILEEMHEEAGRNEVYSN